MAALAPVQANNHLEISSQDRNLFKYNLMAWGSKAIHSASQFLPSSISNIVQTGTVGVIFFARYKGQMNIHRNFEIVQPELRSISFLTHPLKMLCWSFAVPEVLAIAKNSGLISEENAVRAEVALILLPNLVNLFEVGRRSLSGMKQAWQHRAENGFQALKKVVCHSVNFITETASLYKVGQIWTRGAREFFKEKEAETAEINELLERNRALKNEMLEREIVNPLTPEQIQETYREAEKNYSLSLGFDIGQPNGVIR